MFNGRKEYAQLIHDGNQVFVAVVLLEKSPALVPIFITGRTPNLIAQVLDARHGGCGQRGTAEGASEDEEDKGGGGGLRLRVEQETCRGVVGWSGAHGGRGGAQGIPHTRRRVGGRVSTTALPFFVDSPQGSVIQAPGGVSTCTTPGGPSPRGGLHTEGSAPYPPRWLIYPVGPDRLRMHGMRSE